MEILETPEEMRRFADDAARKGRRIGFVPTMGALHHGHGSLMSLARPLCDILVVSVYVNPLQFGPSEDLARYPRDPDGDAALCRARGVDVLFMPKDLYPDGFATSVSVHGLTERFEGALRPGHFEGVATVCARLFGLVRSEIAVFGEKDFQQLMVLRQMARDLALPVRIVPGPLVRDEDGLASSSRNRYLSADQRTRARSLHRALSAVAASAAAGERDTSRLVSQGQALVTCDQLDYLEIVDALTLAPIERIAERPARALVAARYGATRLLDNVAVGPELDWS